MQCLLRPAEIEVGSVSIVQTNALAALPEQHKAALNKRMNSSRVCLLFRNLKSLKAALLGSQFLNGLREDSKAYAEIRSLRKEHPAVVKVE